MEFRQRVAALSPNKKRLLEMRLNGGETTTQLLLAEGRSPKLESEATDTNGQLVAYLAPHADKLHDSARLIEEVRRLLQDKLPTPMQPAAYVILEQLPVTPNGKVDRRALPAPLTLNAVAPAPTPRAEEDAPRTELERLVAEVWRDVLGVKKLGLHDNFFALGGDSIKGIILINRLQERLGKQVQVVALLQAPTIAALAGALAKQYPELANTLTVAPVRSHAAKLLDDPLQIYAVPRHAELAFPLSSAQQRLWFLDQMESGRSVYSVSAMMRLSGGLDVDSLQQSLNAVVQRHEILRTIFVELDGVPLQRVLPALPELYAKPLVSDLRGLLTAERELQARREATVEAARPFDLSRGPLLRLRLWQLGDEEHLALLCMHHMISDGWSVVLMMRELSALYEAKVTGASVTLPELKIQYADYALWQRRRLDAGELAEQLAYWRKRLGGELPALELPTDFPRPPQVTYNGAQCSITLDPELATALGELSRQTTVTPFITYLTAFKCLLQQYAQQDEIIIGCPLADRQTSQTEPLIGFFVNSLVLRTDLTGARTFADALRRVSQVVQDALAHQEVPFERLVEELQAERQPDRSPLFQTMFVLHNDPLPTFQLTGLRVAPLENPQPTAKFELTLSVLETQAATTAVLEYNTDLFQAATAERLLQQYSALLVAVAANPQTALAELPLLSPQEERRMLYDWNATEVEFANEECLPDLISAVAARQPQQLAIANNEAQLSYAELNARANRLAHHLQKLGVGPETCVGVCLERSADWIVSLLAVWKAGGAYVPLDPAYPAERLAHLLADAKATTVISKTSLAHLLANTKATRVLLDADQQAIAQHRADAPAHRLAPENLAYVIYTSGSTGQPKGVEVSHAALLNLINWHQQAYRVSHADRASQLAGLGFDAAVWEVWPYLATGASVHLPAEEIRLAPVKLRDWLAAQAITISFAPTPLAERLLALQWPSDAALRWLLTGGDRLQTHAMPGARFQLVNHYGPTENAVVATAGAVGEQPADGRAPAIGKPIANNQAYVLDRALRPVPVGVVGELYLGGDSLARGYRGRADFTAERFLPNLFAEQPGARMYRTGDRVCYRADGAIDFVGRRDNQVKIRGHRIELAEIEQALRAHPAVRECAVVVREAATGEANLIACFAASSASPAPDADALRQFLRGKLPEFMLPAAFFRLDALPLTAHGKLDHRALLRLITNQEDSPRHSTLPRNPIEAMIAQLWADVLKIERVHANDDFFALGGHSLLATQVVSRLRDAFGVELPLRALFAAPTVAGLAEKIATLRGGVNERQAPPFSVMPRTSDLPLSFAQQRLWFTHHLAPASSANNISLAVRIEGALDTAALEQSLTEIVRRHEILRTIFPERAGRPAQTILPEPALPVRLPLFDLTNLAEAERETEARRLAEGEAQRPFDLAAGPLLRAGLLRLAEAEHVLLLSMHHIVSDGWSLGIFVRELSALYRAFAQGRPSPLPALPLQYVDFAAWQRRWLQGEALEAQLAYWRKQLAGLPPLELPTDWPRPATQSFHGATHSFVLEPELLASLHALSRREGVTLFITLLAAFNTLLHHLARQDDIVLGADIANRNRTETEGLIGFFVNMLVLRTDVSGDPSFCALLRRVRDIALDAYAHQDAPFEKLVEALHAPRELSRNPLFQVAFVLQNTPMVAAEIPGLNLTPLDVDGSTTQFDLVLSLREESDGLRGALTYSTDLFASSTMALWAAQFQTLLRQVVINPEAKLSALARRSEPNTEANAKGDGAPERFRKVRLNAQLMAQVTAELRERAGGNASLALGLEAESDVA